MDADRIIRAMARFQFGDLVTLVNNTAQGVESRETVAYVGANLNPSSTGEYLFANESRDAIEDSNKMHYFVSIQITKIEPRKDKKTITGRFCPFLADEYHDDYARLKAAFELARAGLMARGFRDGR